MQTSSEKKIALISVSDKTNIVQVAKKLVDLGYEIISTGGTARFLLSKGISITSVSDFTSFDEILEGRVKTLHPKIHAGILAKSEKDINKLPNEYKLIDLVIVNLYPFEKTIKKNDCSFSKAMENIDIGGPTMLRAAAKNHQRVTTVIDPDDYDLVTSQLMESGKISPSLRKKLAVKVFDHTANYDSIIKDFLSGYSNDDLVDKSSLNIKLSKGKELRYGENPHQKATLYEISSPKLNGFDFEQVSGKPLSYNNLVDSESALSCVKQFSGPACVIVKHANPCGVCESSSLELAYSHSFKCDPTSAFGGIIAINRSLTSKLLMKIINNQFVEVIIAPDISKDSYKAMKKKPNIRILRADFSKYQEMEYDIKSLKNKILIQTSDIVKLKKSNLKTVTKKEPSASQLEDLIFAFKISRYVKSNSIVFVKNKRTLAIGAGQMSRIDSTSIAIKKAKNNKISLKNSVMASEAFFPFRDNIDLAYKVGVKSIIQPGGSVKDSEIIKIADEHKMSMVFSKIRVFKH